MGSKCQKKEKGKWVGLRNYIKAKEYWKKSQSRSELLAKMLIFHN